MSFVEKLKVFASQNKLLCGILGVAGVLGISFTLYSALSEDETQINQKKQANNQSVHPQQTQFGIQPKPMQQTVNIEHTQSALQPQIGVPEDKLLSIPNEKFQQIAKAIQKVVSQATKQMQQEVKQKRLIGKKIGMNEYIQLIIAGMRQLDQTYSSVQNSVLEGYGLNQQQFQQLCNKNPNIIKILYEMENQMMGGKVLSLEQTKKIIQTQLEFLQQPELAKSLKEAVKDLPQDIIVQTGALLHVMIHDYVEEKLGFEEPTINSSMMAHGKELTKDIQQQQILMERVVTEVIHDLVPNQYMGGYQGFGGNPGQMMMPGMPEMPDPAQLAQMLGVDPQYLNDVFTRGDNQAMMQMFQNIQGRGAF